MSKNKGFSDTSANRYSLALYELANESNSLSKIEDANFAEETSALTKAQILQQASQAMLAQANQGKSGMLQLIQGL